MAITDALPDFNTDFLGISGAIVWLIVIVIILAIMGVFGFMIMQRFKYNKKIVILEDVQGSDDLEPIGKDRATLIKVAQSGMEVLYLKKRKVYKGAYGKRMGKNTYYFAIGPDGYWYNVTLGALKEGLKTVRIKPTPVNMRYQNEALQEIIKQRYDKTTFLQKYGGMIAFTALVVMFGIMAYLLLDKFGEISAASVSAIEAAGEVQEETAKIIGALDQLKGSGGVRSA